MEKKKADFIVIGNYAIKIKDIKFIKVIKKKRILISLHSNEKLKISFYYRSDLECCLDNLAESLEISDYHCPRQMFNRGWRW